MQKLFEDTQKVMITKGAVDVLLGRVACIKTRDWCRKTTQSDREAIEACNSELSQKRAQSPGLSPYIDAAENGDHCLGKSGYDGNAVFVFLGLISMMDPPREGSKGGRRRVASKPGIKPVMITGRSSCRPRRR